MKKTQEFKSNYLIDYDLYSVSEIITLINFFRLIESTKNKKIAKDYLLMKYQEYRQIVNNKATEKKYDKMLILKSQVSIYQVIKNCQTQIKK